ncbi:MAG: PepSY-like domain-containing protein [Pirellulaceae bacterium]
MIRGVMLALGAVSLASVIVVTPLSAAEKGDRVVGLNEIPTVVREAIASATKGARITKIEKGTENGKTCYEVEVSRKGAQVDLAFDDNGHLVGSKVEGDDEQGDGEQGDNEQGGKGNARQRRERQEDDAEADDAEVVPTDKIPAAALKALRKLAGGAEISGVQVEDEDGVRIYEGAWKVKAVQHEATVTADGTLVSTEQIAAAKAAPQAVQTLANKAFPKGTQVKMERKTIVLYEVEAIIDGKVKEILVAPTGQRIEISHADHQDKD